MIPYEISPSAKSLYDPNVKGPTGPVLEIKSNLKWTEKVKMVE